MQIGISLFLMLLCMVSPDPPRSESSRSVTEQDAWAANHYEELLGATLIDPLSSQQAMPRDARWVIRVRIAAEGVRQRELAFAFYETDSRRARVVVTRPQGQSILEQTKALRYRMPNASVEELGGLVDIERLTMTASTCAGLSDLRQGLYEITLSPLLPEGFAIHPSSYIVSIEARGGNVMQLVYRNAPGPNAAKQPDELLGWIEAMRVLIEQCGVSPTSDNKRP